VSVWALWGIIGRSYALNGLSGDAVLWVAVVLMALALLMLAEAVRMLFRPSDGSGRDAERVPLAGAAPA
jgi:hypothetical protein